MDLWPRLWLVALLTVVIRLGCDAAAGNVVFNVRHKFTGRGRKLGELRAHDARRHSRILSAVDLPLGGDSGAESVGLYFTKIGLGTPSNDYYVQVDTGSDILWVNCAGCTRCPRKSDLGIKLRLFDNDRSSTAKPVTCGDKFCLLSQISTCHAGLSCPYVIAYGDGSSTSGHFVRDIVQLDQVTGNHQTGSTNGTIVFGCSTKQAGQLGESVAALDGILGFGQSNSSFISQLAAGGKVKRAFAHCLDNVNGGGIFALGEVVAPKVKMTPMVPNQAHYNVVLKAVEVGGGVLELPTDVFDARDNRGTIIDSGTTLAYLPDIVYESLMNKVLVRQPGLELHTEQDTFTCFRYTANVNDGFPAVTFLFEDALSLTVHPQDYLFQNLEDEWCFGWQNSGLQTRDGGQLTILGDIALSNKLVVYDIQNQVIGWTEHNCSSGIKVRDETSGAVYTVNAQNLSSSSSLQIGRFLTFFSILIALFHKFTC